jgi:TonB family protein
MKRTLVAILSILSFASDAAAQKDLARERVTLLFKDIPVAQVFQPLARSLGYELTLDPTLRALVSIQVDNVTAQTALNALCEGIGCRWRQDGKRLIVDARTDTEMIVRTTPKGDEFERRGGNPFNYAVRSLDEALPFDITWSPTKIYYAFSMLARMMDAEVDIAPALQDRKLAVDIKSATARQAFDKICAVAGCRWEMVLQPKRVVRVTDAAARGQGASSASTPQIFDSHDAGITPPVPIEHPFPQYTSEAMKAKLQGTVRLSVVVQPDGSVSDVKVVKSLDSVLGLDNAAINTALRWRFTPGTKDRRPVPVRVELEMAFTLR